MKPVAGGRAAVITGIGLALFLPLFTAVLPAAGLTQANLSDPTELDAFVRHHWALFTLPYLDGLILHVAGLVAVIAVYRRLADRSPWVMPATIGGLAWMVLDVAQNGTGLYASHEIVSHATSAVSGPQLVLVGHLTTGLRLAGHVFGGLWVLVIGAVALRQGGLPRGMGWLGVAAGALMSLNVAIPPTQFPLFVLLPVWFIWLGATLVRTGAATDPVQDAATEPAGSLR
ncbi:MAG: DUF4386 family protein [Actinobacteria bacterium]|nr:DUF4386 family protein [Actinomycetota bacterium]